MRWGNPSAWQLALLLIPLLIAVAWLLHRRWKRLAVLGESRVFDTIMPGFSRSRVRARTVCWFVALAFILFGLARPQWGYKWEEVRRSGLDIMVVLDTSNSMLAEDIKPNRLERAKFGIIDILRHLQTDRIGLVAFAGSSFLQCPLTIDYAAFRMTLSDVYAGIIPRGGTEIGQALRTAMRNFEKSGKGDRVIILITDGESHKDDTEGLMKELREKNITVFTVGVGTLDGTLIPVEVKNQPGTRALLKDRGGQVVKTSLEENLLENLAIETGGMYVRALNKDFGLERIYEQGINRLKRADQESRSVRRYEERYAWFLGIGLLLLCVEAAIGDKRRKLS